MCQNVLIFPLFPLYIYYKLEELTHFGLRVLINFSLEIPKHFGLKNHTRKIDKIQRYFALQQAFICPKMFQYLQIIYCWYILKTILPLLPIFPLTLPQLCRIFTTSQLYTNFYQKNWFYFFPPSSDLQQVYNHVACHATSADLSMFCNFVAIFTLMKSQYVEQQDILQIWKWSNTNKKRATEIANQQILKNYAI